MVVIQKVNKMVTNLISNAIRNKSVENIFGFLGNNHFIISINFSGGVIR